MHGPCASQPLLPPPHASPFSVSHQTDTPPPSAGQDQPFCLSACPLGLGFDAVRFTESLQAGSSVDRGCPGCSWRCNEPSCRSSLQPQFAKPDSTNEVHFVRVGVKAYRTGRDGTGRDGRSPGTRLGGPGVE